MRNVKKIIGMSAIAAFVTAAVAAPASDEALVLVGPVNAVIPGSQAAVILGQRVVFSSPQQLTVGETAAVFGKVGANGIVLASQIRHQGAYVAGATNVMLTGV